MQIDAPIAGVRTEANTTNLTTSQAVSNVLIPRANLLMRYAAARTSKVFPSEIASAAFTGVDADSQMKKAARKKAGHTRYPRRSMAARPTPTGGQTGDTGGWRTVILSPS